MGVQKNTAYLKETETIKYRDPGGDYSYCYQESVTPSRGPKGGGADCSCCTLIGFMSGPSPFVISLLGPQSIP